ncbi:MAG: S8 family peptidase [Planctomycetota bacterium]
MPDRPLLLFPTPEVAERAKLPPSPGRIHRPSHRRQGQRLSPIFSRLQTEFEARRIELQQTAAGADPEQVLVIETVGNVENFANAVKKVEGFEWMGEIEADEIAPDADFYDESNRDRELSGRLYLVMTNRRALNEILSLWRRYQGNRNLEFERGLTRFRDVFLHLKDIRRWGVRDRIEETGLLDTWREDLEHDPNRAIRFEVELWFRSLEQGRRSAQAQITELIGQLNGRVLTDSTIEDISYHALLAEVPGNAAQQVIDHPEVDLIKCDSVMFFRPVGQMATGKKPVEGEVSDHPVGRMTRPSGQPIVAILDGLPLENHVLLAERLSVDDPDNHASEYAAAERAHGTSMASLVVHGDLSDGEAPLPRPVYVRPIMRPIPWIDSPRPEQIPDDVLVVDYIHRAVRRIFEGEGRTRAVAPSVRIINFSIGDPCRQFTHAMSPLARLLDWLSVTYNVLFVISAGNHPETIETGVRKADYRALSDNEKEAVIVRTLYGDARNRKILAPAESINGVTVGALHRDSATVSHIDHAINLLVNGLPSPISSFGSGYRRAIKPDIVFDGGRILYTEVLGSTPNAHFDPRHLRIAPGNKVATPGTAAGDLSKVAYCCGTSNAAALTSRVAAQCHDALLDVFEEQAPDVETRTFLAPLLKAMVVHGSSWGTLGARLQEILQTEGNGHHIRNWIARWLGYGIPDRSRVMACTEQRATVLGFGQLGDGEAHLFKLPLPPSLGARRDSRRLTATLAWLSPVACRTQRYRIGSLWFEVEGSALASARQNADWRAVRRGTVQHEVFEGEDAVPITDGDAITIKVNCRKDAGKIQSPIPYGLVVSLEVAEGIDIAIYDEIRTRIVSAIEIRTRGGR